MAKKKTATKKPPKKTTKPAAPQGLTDAQVVELAGKLLNTRQNVCRMTEYFFNVKVGEEIFDRLEAIGYFKCENCDLWLEKANRDKDIASFCIGCVETMNQD